MKHDLAPVVGVIKSSFGHDLGFRPNTQIEVFEGIVESYESVGTPNVTPYFRDH